MDVTRRLNQNKKLINNNNPNHGPKDVVNGHMGTQLVKLNEAINRILKVKRILKMLENHVKEIVNQQVRDAKICQPKKAHK
jgi:hypothetical protein